MRRGVVLTIYLFLLCTSVARAEFYHWVDKDGKEFYTNERTQVPKEYQNTATAVNPDESRVSVGERPVAAGKPKKTSLKDHKDKYGRGEEHWRKRAEKLRKELAALQDRYDLILKQEKEDENKPKKLAANSGSHNKKSRTSLEKKKTALGRDLTRKKHELEVELPEEARKADAYPGWIRE
jgi:predicted  nucleic acid-binding Zn-ribbon protein